MDKNLFLNIFYQNLDVLDDVYAPNILEYFYAIKYGINRIILKKNKTDSYKNTFNKNGNASMYEATKVVQDVMDKLIQVYHIAYYDKIHNALLELYNIGMYGEKERNRVEALSKFLDKTEKQLAKVDNSKVETNINVVNNQTDVFDVLQNNLLQVTDKQHNKLEENVITLEDLGKLKPNDK